MVGWSRLVVLGVTALAACSVPRGGEPVPSVSTSATVEGATAATVGTAPPSLTEPSVSTSPALKGLAYRRVVDLPFPTILTARSGDDRPWVATKDGRLWVIEEGAARPAFDLSDRVRDRGEQGFLGMAFDPADPDLLYVHYSALDGDTVLSVVSLVDGSERILLRIEQPAANHNGGMLQFDDRGWLYLGLGDGGGAGDTYGNAQNLDTLLGGIVRIDPEGDAYTIPPTNPFPGRELWAYGLRNPWRFWIDGDTIYIADVGQDQFEEIDIVPLADVGYNFGWPITEGLHCFRPGCDMSGITLPVVEIPAGDAGACAVTGGVVYRGSALPELVGHYFYSDYCGGWLRSLYWDGDEVSDLRDWTDQVGTAGNVVSFGVDGRGEVYVLTTSDVRLIEPVR